MAVLLAPSCLACGTPLRTPADGPVCAACWQSIRPLAPPLCHGCGEPVASGAFALCPQCRIQPSAISLGRAAGSYEGALRELIHALKYDARRGVARRLSRLMRERCREALDGADLAVPVPLHWRRRLTRGFNQAEDLARGLGLPVCRVLRRARATRPQFGLRPGERQRNVRAAFRPRWRWPRRRRLAMVEDACVVLVDDLATTGATLRECAEVLKALGAREVRSVTAARALTRRP